MLLSHHCFFFVILRIKLVRSNYNRWKLLSINEMDKFNVQLRSFRDELMDIERDISRKFADRPLTRRKLTYDDVANVDMADMKLHKQTNMQTNRWHKQWRALETSNVAPLEPSATQYGNIPHQRISRTSLALLSIGIMLYYIMLFLTNPQVIFWQS